MNAPIDLSPLPLTLVGDPLLRAQAAAIADPGLPEIVTLAQHMVATMYHYRGVGLAAPQAGQGVRLIVFRAPPAQGDDDVPLTVLANPVFEPLEPDMEDGLEGCLSIPELRGVVPRYRHILYRGMGLDGKVLERVAHGFHARVVQHEIDHLNGILYLDRMTDTAGLRHESFFIKQMQQQDRP